MKLKKTIAGFIFLLLVLTAFGCGTETNGSKNKEADVNAQSTMPAENTNEPGLKGDFEIQYFVGGYGDTWWKQVIAEFQEANPNLTIKQSAGPKINDQMKPRWIQGNPPDVVYIDGAGANEKQMIEDDQLLDLTEWLKGVRNTDGELINDIVIAGATDYDGKNYTLPLVFGSWGIYYDKALFKEKGWKVPTDWQSFMEVSQMIKDDGISPFIHTGLYPYYIHGGLLDSAMVAANGGDGSILTRQTELEEGAFSSAAVKTALNKVKEMVDKGFINQGSAALNHTDSQSQWLQHQAAFIPVGLWLANEMQNDIPEGFDFGFAVSLSQDAGQSPVAVPYTNTIAIAKKAKNPEAAKAFLQFAFTKQQAVKWAEATGAIMNVKADLDSSSAAGYVKDAMSYFNDPNTTVAPVANLGADVQKAKEDATLALTVGKITPEEWMQRMEAAAAKARK